jgi:signal transduction histidine kinase
LLELMQTVPMDPSWSYTQTAAGSARDMMRMVNGILTLTELQAGASRPSRSRSACAVCSRLACCIRASAEARGWTFSVDVADGVPDRCMATAPKIRQCLECLLDNAIKFTCEGGVALRVTGKPDEAAGAVLCGDRHRHRLSIIWTGRPVPASSSSMVR